MEGGHNCSEGSVSQKGCATHNVKRLSCTKALCCMPAIKYIVHCVCNVSNVECSVWCVSDLNTMQIYTKLV